MAQLSRRRLLQGMAAAAAGAPSILHAARRAGDKPNLLFLWTDQQRANTMAVYGNHRFRVPVMNDLASRSVVFEKAYVSQPVCTPSRSTIMTGLYPHQNGCVGNNIPLRAETKTLPELVNDSSYRTGYMGKWHLGDEVFRQHGFQEWVSIEDIYWEYFSAGRDRKTRSSYHHFLESLGNRPEGEEGRFSRDFASLRPLEQCKPAFLANEAGNFIRRHQREPWILYVNFLEPHPPYYGPFNGLHEESEAPMPRNYPGTAVEREPGWYSRLRENQRAKVEDKVYLAGRAGNRASTGTEAGLRRVLQQLNRNYAGLCSQVDEALGRIFWALETSGQADNTVIVFTSDHGEMGGSHSLIQKTVAYEEAIWVPMLLHVPFRQNRKVPVSQPVGHIDLVPTLLELMTGKKEDTLPGESWVWLLDGGKRREDHVFVQWTDREGGPSWRMAISPDGLKLAQFDRDNSLLFDRNRDPLEMSNLYYRSDHAAEVRRLRSNIERWQKATGDVFAMS